MTILFPALLLSVVWSGQKDYHNHLWDAEIMDFYQCHIDMMKRFGIEFWIQSGSLLSALRGDIIPWECDIDLAMTNTSYEKWKELFLNRSSWHSTATLVPECSTFLSKQFYYEQGSWYVEDAWRANRTCRGFAIEPWVYTDDGNVLHCTTFSAWTIPDLFNIPHQYVYPLKSCDLVNSISGRRIEVSCPQNEYGVLLEFGNQSALQKPTKNFWNAKTNTWEFDEYTYKRYVDGEGPLLEYSLIGNKTTFLPQIIMYLIILIVVLFSTRHLILSFFLSNRSRHWLIIGVCFVFLIFWSFDSYSEQMLNSENFKVHPKVLSHACSHGGEWNRFQSCRNVLNGNKFDGLEIDVVYNWESNDFHVDHDDPNHADGSLDEFLNDIKAFPSFPLWIDVKYIPGVHEKPIQQLAQVLTKYNMIDIAFVEVRESEKVPILRQYGIKPMKWPSNHEMLDLNAVIVVSSYDKYVSANNSCSVKFALWGNVQQSLVKNFTDCLNIELMILESNVHIPEDVGHENICPLPQCSSFLSDA